MATPTKFNIFPSSQKGDVYATEFTLTCKSPQLYNNFTWSLGDGTYYYNKFSVAHTYNFPGNYTVSLSAWNKLT